MSMDTVDHNTSGLKECVQCGQSPATLDTDDRPEVLILEENFGDPYLFGVRCRICGRVASGVGKDKALKAWDNWAHDFDMDQFGQKEDE